MSSAASCAAATKRAFFSCLVSGRYLNENRCLRIQQMGRTGDPLVEQLEKLRSGVLIEGVGELGNGRRDLQAALEDDLLSL